MSQPTDPGLPPSEAKEHDRPTVVDVRVGPPPRDDSSSTERPPVAAGLGPRSRVGEYELLREIGRGGMGVVFQARHLRLNRVVALKMILGCALAPAEDLHRFDTEVAAAAKLQHPGIVALYEVSTQFEQPYFSMEYISGSSLAQRLALGPMANRRAAVYLEAVARAVHHAHVRGIVHRDLKPANILLDEHDQPKVTDFGLAKVLAGDSGQTRTGAVLGTPSYMSPEQGAGQRAVGPPSDVWSLGAILYELLTGRPPFRGETAMATLQQVAHKDPVPPRLFDPAISPDLETICLKCLEKEPARRYYSAEALADDLRRFLREEPILARPVPAFARFMSWVRRKPAQALTAGGALAAVVLFTLFLFISSYEERRLRNEAEKAERLAQIREEAMRHLLYLAEMRRAQQALEQADFDRVQRLLKHWEPREGERDLRDWEWHFLRTHSQGPHSVHAHVYQASAVAWRPDGKEIATAGGEPSKPGEIKIWDATTGKLLATMQGHKLAITSLAWHPQKNLLASGNFDKTVRLWDVTLHKELATLTGHRAEVKSVAFAPGGDRLASGSRDKSIRIWNVDQAITGKTEPRMLRGHEADVTAVAFAPHGDVLASASADKTVRLWSLATMSEQHVLRGHDGPVSCLAFGPEATFLASGGGQGSQRGEVTLWNVHTGQRIAVRFGLSNRVNSLSCNASGVLAAGINDGFVHIWNQAQTSEGQTFRGDKQVLDLAFSPDGRQLAVARASGRVSFFNSSGSVETLRLSATAAVEAVAFSNIAPLVAIAGRQGSFNVWNLDHPGGPIPYAGHAGTIMSAAFSPGGKLLAGSGEDGKILIHDVTLPER